MPPTRPKPPTEKRTDVIESVRVALQDHFKNDHSMKIDFLLGYFTTIDLVHILQELKK